MWGLINKIWKVTISVIEYIDTKIRKKENKPQHIINEVSCITKTFIKNDYYSDIVSINSDELYNLNDILFKNISYESYIWIKIEMSIIENELRNEIQPYKTGITVKNNNEIINFLTEAINEILENYNVDSINKIIIYKKTNQPKTHKIKNKN